MHFHRPLLIYTLTIILLTIIEAAIVVTIVAIIVAIIIASTIIVATIAASTSRSSGSFNRQHSGGRVPCQICHSQNHEASDCFERMNHAFVGKNPPAKLATMCAHTIVKSSSPTWILDSGATSHITNDISAIHSNMPYHGEDKVYIGDGQGMPIYHTSTLVLKNSNCGFSIEQCSPCSSHEV